MIVDASICSNCKQLVPDHCDGHVFRVADWKRLVCRGLDGNSLSMSGAEMRFRIVVGHGNSYDVPAIEVKE